MEMRLPSFFPPLSSALFSSVTHSLQICLPLFFFIFFHHSFSVYYFPLLLCPTHFFLVFFSSAPPPSISHCQESESTDFISDAMCHATSALKGSRGHGFTTLLCPRRLCPLSSHPSAPLLPNHSPAPTLISSALPPSILSALPVYNMTISCLWQMKDLLHTSNCSLESRAVEALTQCCL